MRLCVLIWLAVSQPGCFTWFGGVLGGAIAESTGSEPAAPAPRPRPRAVAPPMTASDHTRCMARRDGISAQASMASDGATRARLLTAMPNCLDPYWETPELVLARVPPAPSPQAHRDRSKGGQVLGGLVGAAIDIGLVVFVVLACESEAGCGPKL